MLIASKIEETPKRVDSLIVHAFNIRAMNVEGGSFTANDPVCHVTLCQLLSCHSQSWYLFVWWHRNTANIECVCWWASA